MIEAFGEVRTVPATDKAKTYMKQLVTKNLFKEQADVWRLGASLGISTGKVFEEEKRETFQNINSLDPDGIFAAIMIGLYPEKEPEERFKLLVNYAEWGIREIFRQSEIGTLDFSKLGLAKNNNTY
ncbi:MAG: hypothetical protein GX432_00235 [Candidatus Atribacteria bacterium]|nr:hypothetical protein [Candidatus Atribacteria bacterium]